LFCRKIATIKLSPGREGEAEGNKAHLRVGIREGSDKREERDSDRGRGRLRKLSRW
jgi:hypothetical protein